MESSAVLDRDVERLTRLRDQARRDLEVTMNQTQRRLAEMAKELREDDAASGDPVFNAGLRVRDAAENLSARERELRTVTRLRRSLQVREQLHPASKP